MTSAERWLRIEHAWILTPARKGLEILVSGLISMNRSMRFSVCQEVLQYVQGLLGETDAAERLRPLTPSDQRPDCGPVDRFELLVADPDPGPVAQWPGLLASEPERAGLLLSRVHRLRLAAWDFMRVASVCDPGDYGLIVKQMRLNGGRMDLALRLRLAQKALDRTAAFEKAVASALAETQPGDLKQFMSTPEGPR